MSAGAIHSPAILLRSGSRRRRRTAGRREPQGPRRDTGLRDRVEGDAPEGGGEHARDVLAVAVHLRLSPTPDPNDMQIVWFNAVGPTDDGLAGGRLIGAVMRVFSHGEVRLRSQDPLDRPGRRVPHAVRRTRPRAAARLRAPDDRRRPPSGGRGDQRRSASRSTRRSTSSTPTPRSTPGSRANVNDYVHAVGHVPNGAAGRSRCGRRHRLQRDRLRRACACVTRR